MSNRRGINWIKRSGYRQLRSIQGKINAAAVMRKALFFIPLQIRAGTRQSAHTSRQGKDNIKRFIQQKQSKISR
jgi:hypothetical protein